MRTLEVSVMVCVELLQDALLIILNATMQNSPFVGTSVAPKTIMTCSGSSWLSVVRQLEELKHLSRLVPNQKKGVKVREKVRRLYKLFDERMHYPGIEQKIKGEATKIMECVRLRWPETSFDEPFKLEQVVKRRLR